LKGFCLIKVIRKYTPQATIDRLSIYHRTLVSLIEENKEKDLSIISSSRLSEITGIKSYQIRKDLSYFGEFGKRGIGYPVLELTAILKEILKSNQKWDLILVGVGNLGTALLHYKGFSKRGFRIRAVFDNDLLKVGKRIGNIRIKPIQEMEMYLKEQKIQIAIIAVPVQFAQEIADKIIAGGVRSILNFAPISIKHPPEISIKHIDIAIELEKLVYYLL